MCLFWLGLFWLVAFSSRSGSCLACYFCCFVSRVIPDWVPDVKSPPLCALCLWIPRSLFHSCFCDTVQLFRQFDPLGSFTVYEVGPEQQLVQDPVPSARRLVNEEGFQSGWWRSAGPQPCVSVVLFSLIFPDASSLVPGGPLAWVHRSMSCRVLGRSAELVSGEAPAPPPRAVPRGSGGTWLTSLASRLSGVTVQGLETHCFHLLCVSLSFSG